LRSRLPVENRSQYVFVDPSDDRHAHGVTEPVEILNRIPDQGKSFRSLKPRVFPRGHPPHPQPPPLDGDDDLPAAAATDMEAPLHSL